MWTITEQELGIEPAAVDAAAAGRTVVITRGGVGVAELGPVGRRRLAPTAELIRRLADPTIDCDAMRAELDEALGVDDWTG